jgi:hypothetical protein
MFFECAMSIFPETLKPFFGYLGSLRGFIMILAEVREGSSPFSIDHCIFIYISTTGRHNTISALGTRAWRIWGKGT